MKSLTHFSEALLKWFEQHGRKDLPWQQDTTPYRVWVSEIMLQQTQVATVIPYYQRFMAQFPDVSVLAAADQDQVLHQWTGLGYYARARNLHKCAKTIVSEFGSEFPSDIEELVALPGIGRSTAGAILSIAFKQRAPILDGNVKRVLARFYAVEGWTGQSNTQKQLWHYAEALTPTSNSAAYTQAIMDLGATICTRSSPKCDECPVSDSCVAYGMETVNKFPQPKPRKALPVRQTHVLILSNESGQILLEKRPANGIWGGLWSLPQDNDPEALMAQAEKSCATAITAESRSDTVIRHTFSHFHLEIQPIYANISGKIHRVNESNQLRWYTPYSEEKIGLAAPIKKLIEAD